tara:strand:- start:2398 stop:3966 length:1569 start_codon:yes stop_codon:yes gene_type:complete
MSTATTAKIISQAGKANPPSLVALYGGTLGERKGAITEIENDLKAVGLNIIEFNARRYLSENDLCLPLVQQIVTELKGNAGSNGTTSDLVNRINESAPVILSTNLSSENRVEMIHQFDSAMKKLAAISIQKKPLVITLQGIERAVSGSFTKISEFISNYINISGFMFVISLGKENLEKELLEANVTITSEEFLEDTFDFVAEFGNTNQVAKKDTKENKSEDFFKPPVGLEVESGAAIAAKRKGRAIPSAPVKKSSSGFKVRELAGKKATIKKNKPKRKIIRKVTSKKNAVKFKAVNANKNSSYLKAVQSRDIFAAKKFWTKANTLSYQEFTEVVNSILDEAANKDSRVRATAITGLASIAKGVSWEMPSEVMDRALIMTGDGSKEVKDAAADAIKEMNAAGVEKSPSSSQTTAESTNTSGSMELNELDTDSMLGKTSGSVASMSIGSGTGGGVKVMGGSESSFGSAPTFKMTEEIPSIKKDNVPKFKPTQGKNSFKVVDDKKKVPKFKPTEKKKKNMFKVVD